MMSLVDMEEHPSSLKHVSKKHDATYFFKRQ